MPWCPKCGYEYKIGYSICSDCNVELVDKLEEQCDGDIQNNDSYDAYFETADAYNGLEDSIDFDSDNENEASERTINTKRNVYVDANVRASEYKLGAISLLTVGIIGIIAIALMNIGIIPFLPSVSKALMNIVMGGLFLIFVIMGFSSIKSYKNMLELAQTESKLRSDIDEYFKQYVTVDDLNCGDMSKLTKEEICLRQYEQISNIIKANFEGVSPEFLDYITENIYVNMFE